MNPLSWLFRARRKGALLLNYSPELSDRYARDGYVIINPGIPVTTLDGARADLDGKYEGRIQDAWKISQNVRAIARAPRVLEVLLHLYGRQALPFQTLNFSVGTEQPTHSDTVHFNSMPSGFMCGVWVALEDIDPDNGPLMYYPGSHKLPEYTIADLGITDKAGYEYYHLYEEFLAREIQHHNLKPAYGIIKKGQALIWAANLLHGGSPRKDRSRTRHSQVTHYFFPGCKYYTPLLSWGDNICWRDPEWIQ